MRAIFVSESPRQAAVPLLNHVFGLAIDGINLERGAAQRLAEFVKNAAPSGRAEGRFVNAADQMAHLRFVAKHSPSKEAIG